MTLKNDPRRDDEVRRETEQAAPRTGRRHAARFLVAAAVALAVTGLSGGAARRAEADSPPCRYNINTNIVIDKETGLMWQRSLLGSYNFDDAPDFCTKQTFGGFLGWRVPTLPELLTIVDDSRTQPAIDTMAFSDMTPNLAFWTSTADPADVNKAWTVAFYGGFAGTISKSSANFIRCVR